MASPFRGALQAEERASGHPKYRPLGPYGVDAGEAPFVHTEGEGPGSGGRLSKPLGVSIATRSLFNAASMIAPDTSSCPAEEHRRKRVAVKGDITLVSGCALAGLPLADGFQLSQLKTCAGKRVVLDGGKGGLILD